MKTFLDTLQFSFSASLNDFSSVGLKQKFIHFCYLLTPTNRKNFIKMNTFLALTHSRAFETFSFHRLGSFIAFKVLFLLFCLLSLHSASRFEFKYFQNNDEVWDLSKSLFSFFIKWWPELAGVFMLMGWSFINRIMIALWAWNANFVGIVRLEWNFMGKILTKDWITVKILKQNISKKSVQGLFEI